MNEEREIDVSGQEAQHHADMLAFQKQAHDALVAAATRPLTPDEIGCISWWGNLGVTDKDLRT